MYPVSVNRRLNFPLAKMTPDLLTRYLQLNGPISGSYINNGDGTYDISSNPTARKPVQTIWDYLMR